jgi:hypothetical protein
MSWNKLDQIELASGSDKPDMYRVNAASRVAIAEILYGDKQEGLSIAKQALKLAWLAESPKLPTSADISLLGRGLAVGRAVTRGVAANVAGALAMPESGKRRRAVLFVARFAI